MAIEIERKFLIDKDKWEQLVKPQGTHFKQGYITNNERTTIRVRVAGDNAYLTIKGITIGMSRKEYEYTIPVAEAEEMLDNFAGAIVEKVRYCIKFAGKLWETDEFLGDNQGLLMAEIELEHEGDEFEIPGWVGEEVTNDKRYYNSNLSTHPFTKWNG